ncbi:MAG: hypothetical protein K2N48_03415 [Muribaculaceae bacterium]|nr:hypothetical protein [Muribaculaceae bacterium]
MMKRSDYRVAGLSQGEIDKSIPSEDLRLKTEDLAIFSNLSLNTNARRVYIFPLRQSQRTLSQLKKHIAKIVNALFKRARLPQATDPFHTVEALWAYAALRVGVPASVLVSHLGHAPLGLPVLKLCKSSVFSIQSSDCGKAAKDDLVGTHGSSVSLPSDSSNVQRPTSNKKHTAQSIDTSNCEANTPKYTEPSAPILRSQYCSAAEDLRLKTQDLAAIGRVFLDNPPRWYAMSLRPGVLFTQVCRRIQLLSSGNGQRTTDNAPLANTARSADTSLSDIELFYPCEEIARAIGKKIVIRERPFIHSVVFFRAKLTDIGPLFARIGDLAWCYRQSSRSGAPYADISERQFQLFQQTIAQFTPDYEVASTGELELRPNDRVQILGGLFAGHEATFEESRVKGQESSISASENGKQKTENANASGVVYRLNIIGDNGIEWRISVDSRLATPK